MLRPVLVTLLLAATLAGCIGASPAPVAPGSEPAGLLFCDGNATISPCEHALSGPGVNEFDVAVNPLNPANAIITANDYGAPNEQGPGQGAVHGLWGSYWVTRDGGETWTKHVLEGMVPEATSPLFGSRFVGDLVVAFDGRGEAHIAGIGYAPVGPFYHNTLFYTSSTDGGQSFEEPTPVDSYTTEFAFHDKPALAVDADGRILLAWLFRDGVPPRSATGPDPGHMRLAISEDGGETWSTRALSHGDSGISASIAIGPDESVNIAWRAYDPLGVRFVRSTDHGATFSEPVLVHELSTGNITLDNANYRAFILPTLVALPDGTLLLTSGDRTEEGDSEVFVARSIDQGASWNLSRLPTTSAGHQFLPTIAASPDGLAVAAWLDQREDARNGSYRLYAALSRDGGISWEETAVSSEPGPQTGDESASFIGDYIGVDVVDDRIYFAWPDLREDGQSRLYAASLAPDP